jgi:Bacterial Ig-like domain/Type IV secretion system pilin
MLFLKRNFSIKIRTVLLVAILFVTVLFLFGSNVQASNDLLGLEGVNPGLGDRDLKSIIVSIIQVGLGFLGILAVILILYAGFVWMTAGGSQDKIARAKKILINASIGLIIILASYAIAAFIFNTLGWATGLSGDGGGPGDGRYNYSGGLAGGVVRSHYPSRGALGVPRNVQIAITFREEIDPESIIDANGLLIDGSISIVDQFGDAVSVSSAATVDNYSYLINPSEPDYLGTDTDDVSYIITLGSGITKANGDSAFGNLGSYDWQFTTSTDLDVTPPRVISVLPRTGSTNPRNAVVQINFNEAINPLSVAGNTADGFNNILASNSDGTLTINGIYNIANEYKTVEFLTDDLCGTNSCGGDVYCLPGLEELVFNIKASTIGVIIFDGAADMVGNSLDGDEDGVAEGPADDSYNWLFNTTDNVDLTPPSVVSVTPGVSSNSIGTRSSVKVVFDKLMMMSSLDANSIMIDQGVNYWISSKNEINHTESFIKHDEFAEYTTYNPLVNNDCKDLYQNCFNPTSGPGDFRIGGDDGATTWTDGTELGNINHTQVPGQLRLNFKGIDTPYLWVARSNLDQVVRVDTATGDVDGPYTVGDNPSRTSVDSYGRVWVANRGSCNVNVILTNEDGSVVYNNQYSTAPACGPRGVAVDIDNNIWIAGSSYVVKLSGQDGNRGDVIAGPIAVPAARYGAVIDRNGNLWVDNYWDGNIAVVDTTNNVLIRNYQIKPATSGYMYGITADPEGNIWLAGAHRDRTIDGSTCDVVMKLDTERIIAGETTDTYEEFCTGGSYVRGVSVDKYGYLWATNYNSNKVTKMTVDGIIIGMYDSGSSPLGISADAEGNIWAVNRSGGGPNQQYGSCSGGTVTKYNAIDGNVIGTYCIGGSPYTYSDMTGFGYQSVINGLVRGEWTSNGISLEGNSSVSGLYIHGDIPAGSSVEMQIKGATTQSELATATWQVVVTDGSVNIAEVAWVQIKLVLQSVRPNVTPSINYISINKINLE